jgi:hypothetical protein
MLPTYTICGAIPSNCDTATATVVVNNVINAVNDLKQYADINSNNSRNVTTNDNVKRSCGNANNTDNASNNRPLSIDANGNVTVAANTT